MICTDVRELASAEHSEGAEGHVIIRGMRGQLHLPDSRGFRLQAEDSSSAERLVLDRPKPTELIEKRDNERRFAQIFDVHGPPRTANPVRLQR